ncbi:hypothetical protein [Streptomyces sp. NPDC014676]|uniref:hypothetical protein n=1 Tax=Streptomyces sp. NPDC014676 TaxID=3364879 RepID=UPI0036F6B7AB
MNDDGAAAQCACQRALEHLRDELHRLVQQAGLGIGDLAAEVHEPAARVRRWFRKPDGSADLVAALAEVCVHRMQRRGHRPASHLCDPQWWRDQLNAVNIHVLFGVCTAEQTTAPMRTRLLVRTVQPIVRHVPVFTSVLAVVLFAYVLVLTTTASDPAVRSSPSAAASMEASEQAAETRRDPPAAGRDERTPLATSSASPQPPGSDNTAPACRAFVLAQGDYAAVVVVCPGQGVVLVCPITDLKVPVRGPHWETQILEKCSVRS